MRLGGEPSLDSLLNFCSRMSDSISSSWIILGVVIRGFSSLDPLYSSPLVLVGELGCAWVDLMTNRGVSMICGERGKVLSRDFSLWLGAM